MSTRRIAAIVILAILMLGTTYKIQQDKKPLAPVKPVKQITTACSDNADPCIEIKLQGGETYKLNDFRFVPTNCIEFISLPDHKNHNYCGLYELHWIGPDTSKPQSI